MILHIFSALLWGAWNSVWELRLEWPTRSSRKAAPGPTMHRLHCHLGCLASCLSDFIFFLVLFLFFKATPTTDWCHSQNSQGTVARAAGFVCMGQHFFSSWEVELNFVLPYQAFGNLVPSCNPVRGKSGQLWFFWNNGCHSWGCSSILRFGVLLVFSESRVCWVWRGF